MSANIIYRQAILIKGKCLSCYAPSAFITTMEKAFGQFPLVLDENAIPRLEGMAVMCNDAGGNPYQELIDAINSMDKIEVSAVY